MKTLELAKKYHDFVVGMRREFHRNPEVSMKEFNTQKRIREELDKIGVENVPCGGTGVLATIKGTKPGLTVGLRADIDALTVVEENDKEYASAIPGVMHACGHDTHGAMLLGAARILNELRDEIKGTVKFFFQPGEEVGLGALAMIKDGALEGVDGILGVHVSSELPSGVINAEGGPRMASADMFKITITGKGGHGAHPEETIDAVVVGAATVMNLQTIVSREFSPLDPLVVTVGSLNSGTRMNVIAPTAILEGTVRYFRSDYAKPVKEAIERIMRATAEAYRATAELEYTYLIKPTFNDEKVAAIAEKAAAEVVGDKNVVKAPLTTGGEDFSEYSALIPGVMTRLGTGNAAKGTDYPHHHGKFDVDEDAFVYGSAYYAQFALDFLDSYKK
ncbi:MAG: amidohydrolase [Fusobacteriaceae bacterium]|jgi:amidohydrolase|nr:amidohydrolase [Fusobacteriaceae bacterium]